MRPLNLNLLPKLLMLSTMLCFTQLASSAPKYKTIEKLVAAAGTRACLSATDLFSSHARLKARSNNAGLVYVGGADVAAANGYHLAANAEIQLGDLMRGAQNEAINLKDVCIDAATNGDGVRVIYIYDRYKSGEPTVQ